MWRNITKELRGEKGVQVLLRDARGRIQGQYQHGIYDRRPVAGKDLTLSIDANLQALGERLLEGKMGSIVAIEPSTGEVLCMVSAPSYDPRIMVGRSRSKNHRLLSRDAWKPLLNRSIMGMYPPGSTFKTSQALTYITRRNSYAVDGISLPPRILLPRTSRRMPLPFFSNIPCGGYLHILQRILLLGTLLYDWQSCQVSHRGGRHEHVA